MLYYRESEDYLFIGFASQKIKNSDDSSLVKLKRVKALASEGKEPQEAFSEVSPGVCLLR